MIYQPDIETKTDFVFYYFFILVFRLVDIAKINNPKFLSVFKIGSLITMEVSTQLSIVQ